MAKEVWPDKAIIELSKRVVFLAVHRFEKDETGKGSSDSEWARRLDVMAYPQFRFVDGWARPIAGLDDAPSARTAGALAAALRQAAQKLPRRLEAPRIELPESLMDKVPHELRDQVINPDCTVRAGAWLTCLDPDTFTVEDLLSLFEAETDPIVRIAGLEILNTAPENPHAFTILSIAADGDNDYVRRMALEAIGRMGGAESAGLVAASIATVLEGRSTWHNPNNMLCAAAKVAGSIAEKCLIAPLEGIIERHNANNVATLLAVDSLIAIGHKHGVKSVRDALIKARGLEGHAAERIRRKVDAALGE